MKFARICILMLVATAQADRKWLSYIQIHGDRGTRERALPLQRVRGWGRWRGKRVQKRRLGVGKGRNTSKQARRCSSSSSSSSLVELFCIVIVFIEGGLRSGPTIGTVDAPECIVRLYDRYVSASIPRGDSSSLQPSLELDRKIF